MNNSTAWIGVWGSGVNPGFSCGCFSASGSVSSCQPVVPATLRSRLRVSSLILLPGSTDLFSSAPFCCAQPLQLCGNGGWRQGSAAPLSWTSLHPAIRSRCSYSHALGRRDLHFLRSVYPASPAPTRERERSRLRLPAASLTTDLAFSISPLLLHALHPTLRPRHTSAPCQPPSDSLSANLPPLPRTATHLQMPPATQPCYVQLDLPAWTPLL